METPHRCPPYSSKRPSSGTFSGGDTKPTNKNKTSGYTKPPSNIPMTLLSCITVILVSSNAGTKNCRSPTFGSFWIQNFFVDFCLFLHLWQKYSSVSSSSSRSVKLRKQSTKTNNQILNAAVKLSSAQYAAKNA